MRGVAPFLLAARPSAASKRRRIALAEDAARATRTYSEALRSERERLEVREAEQLLKSELFAMQSREREQRERKARQRAVQERDAALVETSVLTAALI